MFVKLNWTGYLRKLSAIPFISFCFISGIQSLQMFGDHFANETRARAVSMSSISDDGLKIIYRSGGEKYFANHLQVNQSERARSTLHLYGIC